ncbi:MAG TPA: hypothetical protein VH599_10005 [Ktedonobacterales bacterium]|jgi:hypothetical protein
MAIPGGFPPPPPRPPFGRYRFSNPLRREYGIRLLTLTLPEPLRLVLTRALRRPPLFDGQQTPLAVQSAHCRRLNDAELARASQQTKSTLVLTEVEVTRRTLEAPLGSISRMTRNTLLIAQGVQLRRLYLALVAQLGQAAALAVFQQALEAVG